MNIPIVHRPGGISYIRALASVFIAVTLLCVLAYPALTHAAVNSTKTTGTGNSLKISPLRTDLTLKPGQSRAVPIYIENLEAKPVALKPIENDFIAGKNELGEPAIILDEDEFAPTHSLKRFMEPLGVITVQPGERKEVKVTITVPQTAAAGGYFGALRFAPVSITGVESVNVSGSVASLIVLTVPGNLTESLQLREFSLLQDGKAVSRLSSPKDVSVLLRMENKGNVQLAPYGNISVTKSGQSTPIYSANINDTKPAGLVLPDSIRRFEIPVQKLGTFGKYTVHVVLGYGSSNETIELTKSFWVVPTTYIVGAIVAILGVIALVVLIIAGLKAYKKRILRNSRRR